MKRKPKKESIEALALQLDKEEMELKASVDIQKLRAKLEEIRGDNEIRKGRVGDLELKIDQLNIKVGKEKRSMEARLEEKQAEVREKAEHIARIVVKEKMMTFDHCQDEDEIQMLFGEYI